MYGRRFEADVLHHVDLAGVRPADLADVVAEHPEGGPHALAPRHLEPRLDVSVRLRETARGVQAGRRVLAAAVPAGVVGRILPAGGDDQVALPVEGGVAVARRVVLPLVVVDVVTGLDLPFAGVDGKSGRSVEVVGEGHGRAGHRRGGGFGGAGGGGGETAPADEGEGA